MSLRDRIVSVGATRFANAGYDGVSMREIADDLRVTKAALYYHFRDKDELFAAVLLAYIDRIGRVVSNVVQAKTDAGDRVRALAEAILALPPEEAAMMRLATRDLRRLDTSTRERIEERYEREFISRIRSVFAEADTSGQFRPVDPSIATWALLGMLYPFLERRHAGDVGELASILTGIFLQGVQGIDVP